MRRRMAGLVVLMAVAAPGAWAQSQSDVVWPTYDSAERSSDAGLTCAALQAEITHVTADIRLLRKAQNRVEDILHSAFDMERYGKTRAGPSGQMVTAGGVSGKEAYAQARVDIVASLRVAQKRQDRLKGLEPDCKPAPQPAAAP